MYVQLYRWDNNKDSIFPSSHLLFFSFLFLCNYMYAYLSCPLRQIQQMAIVRLAKRAHLLHDVADVVNGSHDLSISCKKCRQ